MSLAPPVVRLALAFSAGASWILAGAPLWPAPLALLLFLFGPGWTSPGRETRLLLVASAVAGLLTTVAAASSEARCASAATGRDDALRGRFLATPRQGSAPFEAEGGCPSFTVVVDAPDLPAGRSVVLRGVWREGAWSPWFMVTDAALLPDANEDRALVWAVVRWRDGLVDRMLRLYGAHGPLVAELTLARKEGFDPELRTMFARTGLAHLLSISGFHVGVIAGFAFAALRMVGLGSRNARIGAAIGGWAYVGLIGFPDAASRAALILAVLSISRVRGRPPARWGALMSAFLVLVVLDPRRLGGAGFQLSFAGAAGLVAWAGPLQRALGRRTRGRLPRDFVSAVACGIGATLATTPIVAWHFEQISVVGIPATLLASPLVALALPGAIASVALDFVSEDAAMFVAGGVSALLTLLEAGARVAGNWSWASVWTTRTNVWAMGAGLVLAAALARRPWIGARARRLLMSGYVATGIVGWPLLVSLDGRGTLQITALDVGQGDALAIRSPAGRWVLVDTGPPGRELDPAGHTVVRALRARGVGRLAALVLTHADLDHVGGAAAVLGSLEVGVVYDPGVPEGKDSFVDILRVAEARGVPWIAARAGAVLELDGVRIEILAPTDSLIAAGVETNEASVVLRVRFGTFDALLTGDAYKEQERAFSTAFDGDLEVLKVGHHGSDTSTDGVLLERARPQVALISVGRGNRYGHPTPEVMGRLGQHGVPVRRTDLEGSITVVAREDGTFTVRAHGR